MSIYVVHSDSSWLICCRICNTILDVACFGREGWAHAKYNEGWVIKFQISNTGKSMHDEVWIICICQVCPSCSWKDKFSVLHVFVMQLADSCGSMSKQWFACFHINVVLLTLLKLAAKHRSWTYLMEIWLVVILICLCSCQGLGMLLQILPSPNLLQIFVLLTALFI